MSTHCALFPSSSLFFIVVECESSSASRIRKRVRSAFSRRLSPASPPPKPNGHKRVLRYSSEKCPADKSTLPLHPDPSGVPPSAGRWGESLLHPLGFCSSLELKPASPRLDSTFSSAGNTKEKANNNNNNKSSCFLCLKWCRSLRILCGKRCYMLSQVLFLCCIADNNKKRRLYESKRYGVFAIGSCFWHCSITSSIPHLFCIDVRNSK